MMPNSSKKHKGKLPISKENLKKALGYTIKLHGRYPRLSGNVTPYDLMNESIARYLDGRRTISKNCDFYIQLLRTIKNIARDEDARILRDRKNSISLDDDTNIIKANFDNTMPEIAEKLKYTRIILENNYPQEALFFIKATQAVAYYRTMAEAACSMEMSPSQFSKKCKSISKLIESVEKQEAKSNPKKGA